MILQKTVNLVESLLEDTTLSPRAIANQLGINTNAVKGIQAGTFIPDEDPAEWEDIIPPSRKVEFCPTCRANVRMPCLRCQLVADKT